MSRTTLRAFGALGFLLGCTQGSPHQPADPGPAPPSTTLADAGGISLPDAEALPPATAKTSDLAPFALAQSALFSPVSQVERALPPLSGGTLATRSDGKAVLSDPDRDQVYVVDVNDKSAATIMLESGDEPGRVAIHDKRAYVALRSAGALVTIDLTTQKVSARSAVCAAPRGVSFDTNEARVLVACAGGELVAVAPDGMRVLAKTFVTADLRDVGRDAQGIWVTEFRSAALLRLDASFQVLERELPKSVQKASSLAAGTVQPVGAALPVFSPTLAFRTVSSSSGEPFMLHQRAQATTVQVKVGGYSGGFGTGFCESGVVHTTVTRFGGATTEAQAALPQAVVPLDLSISPDGRFMAVVAPGNFVRQDIVPSSSFGEQAFGTIIGPAQQLYLSPLAALTRPVQELPLGSNEKDCLSNAARWEHRFPGETTAVQFLDARTLLVQVRSPSELHVFRLDDEDHPRLSAVIPLASTLVRDTGHEVFHQNSGSGIACASCHGEALDDGHVWEFEGIGPRRTQHLRGGVLNNVPFHWSGDLASFNVLLDDVYQQRMGGVLLHADVRAALARWLDRVPLVPTSATDTAAATRGRELFVSDGVGCARCHAGESLRAPGSYDVGTGGSFEVPSLRGVSLRLPLMHNGCADTLEKRFEPSCGGGDKHGTTSQLSAAELQDLVAYLRSL